jgi:hypothetical protein
MELAKEWVVSGNRRNGCPIFVFPLVLVIRTPQGGWLHKNKDGGQKRNWSETAHRQAK